MAINREQIISYGTSIGTGGGSFWARAANDISGWSVLDILTAAGIIIGILGVCVRAYKDISEHIDRKRKIGDE